MCSVLSAIPNWFDSHQYLAVWLEGVALLAIFIWDRLDSRKQHEETLAQLDVSQKQANTLINSERAWLMVEIGNLPSFDPAQDGILNLIPHIKNFGKTEGRVKRISIRLHSVPTIGGLGSKSPLDVTAIQFWTEDFGKPGAPAAFSIERKISAPFSANHYFSQAPLQTTDHINSLKEFEERLKQG